MMPPKSSRKLPPRSVSLGQRVWDLPEARDIIFKSMRDGKWVAGLLLSKATFLEAVQALYHTFDHAKLWRLDPRKICPSRYRLYLDSVRYLRYPLLYFEESRTAYMRSAVANSADSRQRLLHAIGQYPKVERLFWDNNLWEGYSLTIPGLDISLGQRPVAKIVGYQLPVFQCSHDTSPDSDRVRDWFPVLWHFDLTPCLPSSWEIRAQFVTAPFHEGERPPKHWLSWMHCDVMTSLASVSRIKIGAHASGSDLKEFLRLRASVDGAASLVAFNALAIRWTLDPLELYHDSSVTELRMLHTHIPFVPSTLRLYDTRCYPEIGLVASWGRSHLTQVHNPGVLECSMVHPVFEVFESAATSRAARMTVLAPSRADLQTALDRAILWSRRYKAWSFRWPEEYPGRMDKIHVQLLLPLRLPATTRTARNTITDQLFECIAPTCSQVAGMLAAGGPHCQYRLSATFYFSPTKEEKSMTDDLSKRLMKAFTGTRTAMEAEQRTQNGPCRRRT